MMPGAAPPRGSGTYCALTLGEVRAKRDGSLGGGGGREVPAHPSRSTTTRFRSRPVLDEEIGEQAEEEDAMDQQPWNPTGTELAAILAEMRPIVAEFARRDAQRMAEARNG
jgi:hypothetical protein